MERTESFTGLALGESDYTKMAYELAVRMPEKYEEIRATQATRIQDPDRKREFNFIVRAVAPETERGIPISVFIDRREPSDRTLGYPDRRISQPPSPATASREVHQAGFTGITGSAAYRRYLFPQELDFSYIART